MLKAKGMRVKVTKTNVIRVLMAVLFISIILNIYLILQTSKSNTVDNEYELLSPSISKLNLEEFVVKQRNYNVNYEPLKKEVQELIDAQESGEVGFYFENLKSGAWIGIDEKVRYSPGSLFKLPAIVAVLKEIEETNLTLANEFTVLPVDLDKGSGSLFSRGYGYNISILELIEYATRESDNTANQVIRRIIPSGTFATSMFGLGIPYGYQIQKGYVLPISTKDASNMFRSLYHSSYLKRPSSQLILSLLSETDFINGIPAGVPKNVKVAHKVGYWEGGEYNHDCGIVYAPQKPYILCIMTKDITDKQAEKLISTISKKVYEYVIIEDQDSWND